MAIISRKISAFPNITKLTGDEYVMIAFNGKSYKMPIKMLTGNSIQSIVQRNNQGDGEDNPITITVGIGDDAQSATFHVYNGQRGSIGPDGRMGGKGPKGDTGIAIYDYDELADLIYDSLVNIDDDEDLSTKILSARQGKILNDKLEALREEFLTQTEYDDLVARDEVEPNVKYFIWEE